MTNPNSIVVYNGKEMMIKELPTASLRAEFGLGHFPAHLSGREVHQGIGLESPDNCTRADEVQGVWINFGSNLVCPGCGLDCT